MAENLDFEEIDQQEFLPDADDEDHKMQIESLGDTHPNNQEFANKKKAKSAFSMFVHDLKLDAAFKAQLGPHSRNFLLEASKKWNELEPDKKQLYQEQAQKYKEQFQQYMQSKQ